MLRVLRRLQQIRNRSYRTTASSELADSGGPVQNFSKSLISSDGELGCSLSDVASLLQRCAKSKNLYAARNCHICVCCLGLDAHPYIHSLLVQVYACTHALSEAFSVFTATHHLHQQSFLWNHIINGLVHHQQYAHALQLFENMQQQCVLPNEFTFTLVLSGFTTKEDSCKGKHLHAIILTCGLHQNVVLATALMTMYQKCGLLDTAWGTFMNILEADEVCWTSIISAHAQHCQSERALHLFGLMLHEGFPPSKFSITCTLDACANCAALIAEGKLLHSIILEHELKIDTSLGNMLIKFYGARELLDDAQHVYDHMQPRDVVSSNSLIQAYAQQAQAKEVCQVFNQILQEGIRPDKVTFLGVIDACGVEEAEGRAIHGFIVEGGFDKDMMLETKVLNMYAKCGRLQDAQRGFEMIKEHNAAACSTMLSGLAQQRKFAEVLSLFSQVQQEGIRPDRAACLCMLDACATLSALMKVKYEHVHILNCGLESDIIICNSLISSYGRCGSVEDACKVFENMSQQDMVSWTAMIGVYAQHSHGKEAVQLFCKMLQEVDANKVTYMCVIDACVGSSMFSEGRLIHFCIVHDGLDTDAEISNALVHMHGNCGSLEDASHVFLLTSAHDVIAWTALVGAYAQYGQSGEASALFENMLQSGVMPNKVTFISMLDSFVFVSEKWLSFGKEMLCRIIECGLMSDVTVCNAVIKMYGECRNLDAACRVFDCMDERNLISWTAIIAVHAQHSKGKEALELFSRMQRSGFEPNSITFVCVLDACASFAALAAGEHIHSLIVQSNLESHVFIGTALVNMYGKCGQLYSARYVFDRLTKRNLLTWTTIIAIYAHHGKGKEAVRLFKKMEHEGFRTDDASLVSILAACSHSGLVDEGSLLFTKMIKNCSSSPNMDHYACVIDLLGRAGRLREAAVLIQDMPCEPTAAALMSLLGSCRQKKDLQTGECAALQVLASDHKNSAPYVVLSNMYASIEME
ncbi:hypothetical protein GOP47_0002394 [Adiantum capillus-veneris]|uniref:Pentatricopeptide repeat-containing protein n=1 Tax=Adiantum capillus-veneris TaxID=13818 RepID=A0A9D4VA14_ADICA|nr:hypothetical protein GOP47_0002394 [Adiantum capillus-veneris]